MILNIQSNWETSVADIVVTLEVMWQAHQSAYTTAAHTPRYYDN
jgi:hypothetical protein